MNIAHASVYAAASFYGSEFPKEKFSTKPPFPFQTDNENGKNYIYLRCEIPYFSLAF